MRRLIWAFAGRTYHIVGNLVHWLKYERYIYTDWNIEVLWQFAIFVQHNILRGYIFQTLLLAWKFSSINKNCFFVKETDTFGHIVVWTTYTSHIDHFRPQHTAFEQSAACLSVFLELLPGLIPLTMLWHAEWTFEENNCMNMSYNYLTTIFRSIFAQNVQISCRKKYIFNFCLWIFQGQIEKL